MANAGAQAKGRMGFIIEEDELQAKLEFVPDPEGEAWGAERLRQLILEHRIAQGPAQRELEDIVSRLSKAKGPLTEVIARGQAPEEPKPEEFDKAEIDVPERLKELAFELVAKSPPPLIYSVKVEKVKVEKIVAKPAALPFLPPKKETVVEWERHETRERVAIDTQVLAMGYAKAGQKLGVFIAGKPGKPGRNVYGKPVQPKGEGGAFLLGEGVERSGKSEAIATVSGVLRIGRNWLDMVPLKDHEWGLELDEATGSVNLSYSPGDPRIERPRAAEILGQARSAGARAELLKSEEELERALAQAASAGLPLKGFSLYTDEDAACSVAISADGLEARMSLRKGRGKGRRLEYADIVAEIKRSGVQGVDLEKVKADVLSFLSGAQTRLESYVLARGRPPSPGKERPLLFSVTFLPDEQAKAILAKLGAGAGAITEMLPEGAALRLAYVDKGRVFASLGQVEGGAPGVDVLGRELPPSHGKAPDIKIIAGVTHANDSFAASAGGILAHGAAGGAHYLQIVPIQNARIEIAVSPDAMSVYASLEKEAGSGAALSMEAVRAALAAKGVVKGIDEEALGKALASALDGKPVSKALIAQGRAYYAVPGGRLLLSARYAAAASGRSAQVAKGDLVAVLYPEQGAEPTYDVLGRETPVLPWPAAQSASGAAIHDASVIEEPGQGASIARYVAATSGEFALRSGVMCVSNAKSIPGDVDAKTGSIRIEGSIKVQGSVRQGFQLIATGDIWIGGSVEAALVSSDGNVVIMKGVRGGGRAVIRSKKRIDTAFADQTLLLAVEGIRIAAGCAQCSLKTNGTVSLVTERGVLAGGKCKAKKGLDACQLGSERKAHTQVSFGQDYLLEDVIEQEQKEIEKLKLAIVELDGRMKRAERSASESQALDAIRQEKLKALKLMEQRSMRVFSLRERFEEHFPSEVKVRGAVFPGVVLESHGRFHEITQRKQAVVFSFDLEKGRIVERPL
jgi:hypothetical protein